MLTGELELDGPRSNDVPATRSKVNGMLSSSGSMEGTIVLDVSLGAVQGRTYIQAGQVVGPYRWTTSVQQRKSTRTSRYADDQYRTTCPRRALTLCTSAGLIMPPKWGVQSTFRPTST
jgi:hypothetical protein